MNARAAAFTALLVVAALPTAAAELLTAPANSALDRNPGGGAMPADEAFAFNAVVEADGDIVLTWEMPPSYYLYRKSLKLEHAGADLLPALELPEATVVTDEFFGESAVYFSRLLARLPGTALEAESGATIELELTWQGCLQDTYCYPPQHKSVSVTLP